MSWIKLNTYHNTFEADLAKSVLESHGIECRIMNAYSAQAFVGAIQSELWVREEDAERALNFLDEDNESGKVEENFGDN